MTPDLTIAQLMPRLATVLASTTAEGPHIEW